MEGAHPMARLLWMTSGLVFWAAQFTIIYGITAVACARGWWEIPLLGLDLVRVSVAAATLLALAATAVVLWRASRARGRGPDEEPSERFVKSVTIWVCALALVAIVYNGLPALILPACSI
jgi:hypothetical protein